MIRKGSLVKIHYTVTSEGQPVESTLAGEPFSYVQGQNKLLASVQARLEGGKIGDKLSFELEPAEAYGEVGRAPEEDIPKSEVPQWDQIKMGMYLQEKQSDGRIKVGRVIKITDDFIRLSFSHPMAGKKLEYKVEILDVINMETKESS